ncbi:hypothetical protein WA026_019715 [Henosepilachna vigintioctopunctata]|uniref:SCP domain-containing protein n=1 Tax=Henosepilachna vigintioctopunctata TaxID=420089 RepID=A0AAW1UHS1_9CUCU
MGKVYLSNLIYLILLSRIIETYGTYKYKLTNKGNETTVPPNLILNLHNGYRQKLLRGEIENQPQAEFGSIKMLKWHPVLANEALKIASTCNFEHVRVNISEFKDGVGQNLFRTCSFRKRKPDWKKPLQVWFQEHEKYRFPDEPNVKNGHYTQLIWGDTQFVGCSLSEFIRNEKQVKTRFCTLYVCNYGPPGNIEGELPTNLQGLSIRRTSECNRGFSVFVVYGINIFMSNSMSVLKIVHVRVVI